MPFLIITLLVTAQGFAQGVPKAYDEINYQGKVSGRLVKFILANGYIGASSINVIVPGKQQTVTYNPDSGVADEKGQLKFVSVTEGRDDYFVLENMQETYEEKPAYIAGLYYVSGKKMVVKFWLDKPRRHLHKHG